MITGYGTQNEVGIGPGLFGYILTSVVNPDYRSRSKNFMLYSEQNFLNFFINCYFMKVFVIRLFVELYPDLQPDFE
jgi:hypothetical protein